MIVFVMCLIFYCTQSHNHHPPGSKGTHTPAHFSPPPPYKYGAMAALTMIPVYCLPIVEK